MQPWEAMRYAGISLLLLTFGFSAPTEAQSLEEALRPLMNSNLAVQSKSSLKVVEIESGRVVGQHTPDRAVSPASNMKLFTTAAGLDLLGSDFQFVTRLSIRGEVVGSVLRGDVKLTGSGDPTLGRRFYDDDAARFFEEIVVALRREGIRRIDGNVIVEHGYFDQEWVHPSWPPEQLVYWYEAPISAPAIQEGTVVVEVHPTSNGSRARVVLNPPTEHVTIENTSVTSRRGRGAFVGRKAGTNTIIVKGNAHPGYGPTKIPVAIMSPVDYFADAFGKALENRGITFGDVMLVEQEAGPGWREILQVDTPLPVAVYVINKQSQNHYAEQLLKTIGAERGSAGSWPAGSAVVTDWLRDRVGSTADGFVMVDGSGMSADNRASASTFVDVLLYMWESDARNEFLVSMPYSGEQSTRMRRRMRNEPYRGSVFAKTGYLEGAVGLSGYVRGGSGKIYAFSLLFNDYRGGAAACYQLHHQILQAVVDRG